MKISKYLDEKMIALLEDGAKEEILHTLVGKAVATGKVKNGQELYKALIEREKIVSTGIGMGVAIPHAKLKTFSEFFISIAILQKGSDWNALDSAPARIIFMVGGPDDRQTEYLQILSTITSLIKDENLRRELLAADSPKEVLKLLEGT